MTGLSPAARTLGFAGLLPQIGCVVAIVVGGEAIYFLALALAYIYAALIFSFIGGAWWGLAASHADAPGWTYGAAVAPSLIALASALPWATGDEWPGPSLVLLGLCILLSPLVDIRLLRAGIAPDWWLRLRVPLSIGLGTLTMVCAVAALG